MRKIFYIFYILLILILSGCTTPPIYLEPGWGPGRIMIMPFTNDSADVSVEKFARVLMYKSLERKKYKLLDLDEIDSTLNELGITEAGQLQALSHQEIKRQFNADSVLYGHIITAKRVMLGVYFEKKFEAEFTIHDMKTESIMWQDKRKAAEKKFAINPDALLKTATQEFVAELSKDVLMKALDSHPLIRQMRQVINTTIRTIP